MANQVEHPDAISAGSQGNAQRLPDGHLFVGWGSTGRFSEFDSGGNLLWDGSVPSGYDTYRAYRSPWVGTPDTDPTAVASRVDANDVVQLICEHPNRPPAQVGGHEPVPVWGVEPRAAEL